VSDWFKAKAEIRVTRVEIDYGKGYFVVSGLVDFLGADGRKHITGKDFTHSFYIASDDPEIRELRRLLERKCGVDLMGAEPTNP
jgi:hypothetical protein